MEISHIVLNDEIINRARQGDETALSLVCRKSMQSVYFIALKILKNEADADDIVSETLITIVEKIRDLKDVKAFDSWVKQIAVNKCYNYIKKMKPVLCGDYSPEFMDNSELEEYNSEFLPEEFVINAEKRNALMEIIKEKTTEMEMLSIVMFYYNDESIRAIAQSMNCAEITVKKRLASARKKIKKGIEERFGKGVMFMATGIITVLSQAIKAEAAETSIPENVAANAMAAAGKAAANISNYLSNCIRNNMENMKNVNGETQMDNNKIIQENTGSSVNTAKNKTGNARQGAAPSMANKAARSGLSKGAIAGICAGAAACIVAIGIGLAVAIGGGDDDKASGINSVNNKSTEYVGIEKDTDVATAYGEKETETEEETSSFVAEEFERYEVMDLGYVTPAVHTEANEECTFIWSYTEEEVIEWIYGQNYTSLADEYKIEVKNMTGYGVFDERNVHIYNYDLGADVENKESADIEIITKGYNKSVVSDVVFTYMNTELDAVLAEMTEFIEYMGFGDYSEQILHSSGEICVETENDLGFYRIYTGYSHPTNDTIYSMFINIGYRDYKYEDSDGANIIPEKMEVYDNYHTLNDVVKNSTFDATNFETFSKSVGNYMKTNMNSTVADAGVFSQYYSYTVDGKTKEKTKYYAQYAYTFSAENCLKFYEDYEVLIELSNVNNEFDKMRMNIIGFPVFDEARVNEIYDLNDADIENLSSARYEILKGINKNIDFTKDYLVDEFKAKEYKDAINFIKDDSYADGVERQYFVEDGLKHWVVCSLEDFEIHIEQDK